MHLAGAVGIDCPGAFFCVAPSAKRFDSGAKLPLPAARNMVNVSGYARLGAVMLRLSLSALLGAFLGNSALAADLPPYEAAIVAPTPISYNWTGFYVGSFAGLGWSSIDISQLEASDGTPYNIGGDYDADDGGFHGGLQVGFDWQWNKVVAGLVGEAGVLWFDESVYDPSSLPNADGIRDTKTSFESDWYAALSARIGVAFNRLLVYAKGGVAFLDAEAETVDDCLRRRRCGGAIVDASDSDVLVGWSVGGGVEYAFNQHWSAGAEYRYFDFGELEPSGEASDGITTWDVSQEIDVKVHTARLTVNYRW
jgi:outer membrane immunogenic protein